MTNPHEVTRQFEQALSEYTGAPFVVAVDNASNGLFLALYYEHYIGGRHQGQDYIELPKNDYPSVPCECIHAGYKVRFIETEKALYYADPVAVRSGYLKGAYRLRPTRIWDSALRFKPNMYIKESHMILSFTGPFKHLKLGKGGAILTDDERAYKWFKKARFSGRGECSYHEDDFDVDPVLGWNFYMMPEIAARGLLLMGQFYTKDGQPRSYDDIELPYPDLSQFKIYRQ